MITSPPSETLLNGIPANPRLTSAAGEQNSLPESLLRMVGAARANPYQSARLLSPEHIPLLKAEMQRLSLLLSPAKPFELKAILGKLALHYSMGNAQVNEIKMLIDDYIEDLTRFPALAVERAAKEYRRNPKSQFFPKVGVLMDLCLMKTKNEYYDMTAIKSMLEIYEKEDTTRLEYQPKMATAGDWENLTKQTQPPEKQTLAHHLPKFDREYFDAKIPKAQPEEFK